MGDSGLKKKVEKEIPEEEQNVKELVKTLIESFLKSDSNYGIIADIKTDIEYINNLVRDYIEREELDVHTIELENRILLTKTGEDFERIYKIIKERSSLQIRNNIIEIWDDAENKILHLVFVSIRKHFPLEYSTEEEKDKTIEKFST